MMPTDSASVRRRCVLWVALGFAAACGMSATFHFATSPDADGMRHSAIYGPALHDCPVPASNVAFTFRPHGSDYVVRHHANPSTGAVGRSGFFRTVKPVELFPRTRDEALVQTRSNLPVGGNYGDGFAAAVSAKYQVTSNKRKHLNLKGRTG